MTSIGTVFFGRDSYFSVKMPLEVNYEDIMRYFGQCMRRSYMLSSHLIEAKHIFSVRMVKKNS